MRRGVLLLAILLSLGISFSIAITNCTEITSAGTYELTQNVYNYSANASPISSLEYACIRISASDVSLDCQGNTISGTIAANRQYGVLILSRTAGTLITNVTVKNCAPIMNYSYGIYCQNESGFAFSNNTIHSLLSSASYGIGLTNCSNGAISGNSISNATSSTASSLPQAAIMVRVGSNNNNITNNDIRNFNATGTGFSLGIDVYFVSGVANVNNSIINNTISNVRHGGIIAYDGSNGSVVANNTITQVLNGNGISLIGSSSGSTGPIFNSRVVNNSIFNTSADCIRLDYPSNVTVANNTVNMCRSSGSAGIFVQSMNNSFILNNSVYNSSRGLRLQGTLRTLIQDNLLSTGDMQGIFLGMTSANDNLTNNTVFNYSQHGIYIIESSNAATNHKVYNNTVFNNSQHGIYAYFGNNNDFRNNTVFNNSQNGIRAEYSNTNNITQCRIFNNTGNGISIIGWSSSNIGLVNQTYLSNNGGAAIYFEGTSGMSHRLANVIIDSPAGGLANYANLSMNDSVSSTSSYTFNWTGTSPSPPFPAFGKFVNITRLSGTVVLDSIAWHWLDSEASGFSENNFTLYRYNTSGWTQVPATLDRGANTLTAASLSGFSDFGILEGNESQNCPVVPSPGIYQQDRDYLGAPNSASPVIDYTCIKITSSNVDWDCNGFGIANNGTAGATSAILLSGPVTNVTLRNCPALSNYSYGIYAYLSNNSTITNVTAFGNTNAAFRLVSSGNMTLSGNTAYNNSFNSTNLGAIHLYNSTSSQFVGNHVYNNTNGFQLDYASDNNRFISNSVHNNSLNGFLLNLLTTQDTGSNFTNNTISNNTNYGVNVMNSNRTFLSQDHFYGNGIDLFINHSTTARVFNLSSVIFDSPLGNFTNYTAFSANDSSVGTNNRYTFTWTSQPAALPPARTSFAGKFLAITRISGTNSLDRVAWHWLDTELNGTNDESRFMLYQYYGGWSSALNSSPDTSSNMLSLSSYNPNGVYAILEDTSIACPVYTSPGIYSLNRSYSGATNPASEIYFGALACIKIGSSDVELDCNGYNITNDGTPDTTMGIVLNGSLVNVTVKNCPNVSSYSYGIYAYDSNGGAFRNITITNSSATGLTLDVANSNAITSMSFIDNQVGLQFWTSGTNNLSSLAFDGNINGLVVFYSNNNNFTDLDFTGQSDSDNQLWFASTSGNVIRNVHISALADTGWDGVAYFNSQTSDIVDNLTIDGAPSYGIALNNVTGLTVQNSLVNSADIGIYLHSISTDNKFINTTISGSSSEGAYLSESSGNEFSNVTIYGTGYEGFYSYDSSPIIRNCHLYANNPDFAIQSDSYPLSLVMEGTIFDNPAGDYQNFTNLSINDTLDYGEYYEIFWAQNASTMPADYVSFGNKFVNITPSGSSPSSIDTLVWSWLDSELGGYDETRFAIFRFNGTWAPLPSTLDAGANTLAISNLDAFSQFGPLENQTPEENITGQPVELFGVNVTNQSLPRWEGSSHAGNATTAPGNLTMADISASMLTDHWAAYFGNISDMDIILGDNASVLVYSWIWDAANDSVLCVSTNSSVHTFEAFPGKRANVDTAWSFDATASDSANNTFTGTNCTLDLGASSISDMDYADTGYPGGFRTCLLKMAISPIKDQMLFCTKTISNSTLWNDEIGDFELLVPTPYAPGPNGYETYYFYMASPG
jgi:parallel beta-helix repeat protein